MSTRSVEVQAIRRFARYLIDNEVLGCTAAARAAELFIETEICTMREIKFRAWDRACKCMVEDSWKLYLNGTVSVSDTWATKDIELMQFTGLKDRNGVEIYEGDIGIDDEGMAAVKWCEKNGMWTWDGECLYDFAEENMKVIGNIHQHPELMEAAK